MSSSHQIKIDNFNPSKISLELWLSLLEANFSHLNVTEDDKKKNVLLVSVGTDVFSILGNLCAPDLPHTKSYADLVSLLKAHYIVKPSYHRSLITFQQRKKRKDETVQELYADLKALAKNCNFGNQFDARVRDQLFMAVDNEIYFPNLVALNIDLQIMTSQAIIERILTMEKAFVSEKIEVQSQVQTVRGKSVSCKHCGFSHDSFYCRFKHLSCNICHKKGHLQKVCKEAKRESASSTANSFKPKSSYKPSKKGFSGKFNSRKTVKTVDDKIVSSDDDDDDKLLNVKDKVYVAHAEQFYFCINNMKVPLEIDSGATVSTLNKDWVERLNLNVEPCKKKLQAYDDFSIEVLGKVVAPVEYNGFKILQAFYVVGSNNTNLCGKNLMKQVGIYLAGLDECTKVNNVNNVSVENIFEGYNVDVSKPILAL